MQSLIIINNNDAHTGKTTALRGVYELMVEKGYKPQNIAGPGKNPNSNVKAIFTIAGKNVGIETMGDNSKNSCEVHRIV